MTPTAYLTLPSKYLPYVSMNNPRLIISFLASFLLTTSLTVFAQEEDRAGLDFFEAKIRPMLVSHCYECHSAGAAAKKKLKGALYLDSREGSLAGGESGPAVVPGKPDESLLISALKHEGFEMPPKGKLPDEIISHFVKWIENGAPDPRDGTAVAANSAIDIEGGKNHWAFQPLADVVAPEFKDDNWIRTEIDAFVRARQSEAGVSPNEIASPRKLIRRAYFSLIGLPPTPEQVEAFVTAAEQDLDSAYAALIDELLANEHYGERWGRHWLDISRFAESNGYAFDGDRPNAWHYRDFVIKALNSDLPYDEFLRLQFAGDLVTDTNVKTTDQSQSAIYNLAATGYLVAGPYTTQQTQKERERSRYEQLDDIVSTVGTSLLGITIGCARCHSHKFDPIPQDDYYRLVANFAEVGFSNTSITTNPEEFSKQTDEFNAAHTPLIDARSKYESETLPGVFDAWLTATNSQDETSLQGLTLSNWHHTGPFPADDYNAALSGAFPPESGVDLAATYQDDTLKWTAHENWKDGDFLTLPTDAIGAHYLHRIITSEQEQTIAVRLRADDGMRIWHDGEEIPQDKLLPDSEQDYKVAELTLSEGENVILLKIANAGGPARFLFQPVAKKETVLTGAGNWYHLGPFTEANHDAAFNKVYEIETQISLDLTATYNDGELKWVEQPEWADATAHNDKLTGNNCANFLYRVIETDSPKHVALSLGSDDGIKVWVNGREVLNKKVARNDAAKDQEKVNIQLGTGSNHILIKIANGGGKTGFYFESSIIDTPDDVKAILASERDKWDDKQKNRIKQWHQGFDFDWLALNKAVVMHEANRPSPAQSPVFTAKVKGTSYQFGEDTYKVYHLRRGNSDNKLEEAQPGYLRVLMNTEQEENQWLANADDPESPKRGREAIVDWLSDVEHGAGHLLARVLVNRMWYHHFGRGIVATPSDFGTRGERPSHPQLLDWLASELIRNEWRLKPIHKLILTSAVYMQDAEITDSGEKNDPENFLLWRRAPRRLEAEIIRDSLLSVSGTLDDNMFGKGSLDVNQTRRSIYFTVKRGQLIPMLTLFDAPDAMQGIATREQSTVAPQALAMLNSPIIRGLATKFASRIRPNAETSIDTVIESAYHLALGRPATDDEKSTMTNFIERQKSLRSDKDNAEELAVQDFCQLILCLNEFIYIE